MLPHTHAQAQGRHWGAGVSAVHGAPPWRLLGGIQGLPGHAYGCRYPSLVFAVQGRALSPPEQQAFWACFELLAPGIDRPDAHAAPGVDWRQTVDTLLYAWQALQRALGLPVYEPGRVLAWSATWARCVLPTQEASQRALATQVQRTLDFLNQMTLAPLAPLSALSSAQGHALLAPAAKALASHSPKGSNVPRFIKAAFELDLPFCPLPGGGYQYGVGRLARWLDSSFTDETPAISAKLARNKVLASALLRQAGLPVPSHSVVASADDAVATAKKLGYPVVVKPSDRDGGVGVAAGLCTDEEVRQAFAQARTHSSQILVEKHVHGRDYRLTVFHGEVIWAIERVPAGVTGDGRSSVAQLVALVNADPRRGTGTHAPLKRLELDVEAIALLGQQGLVEQAVPESGRFVRLRRAANVASGGTPIAAFGQVHPDNARLAARAADALRLDLAGIDLLIPDVAVSWLESGAAICEVNGQPNLGQTTAAHLYAPLLKRLVPGAGRVPVIYVLGAAEPARWACPLEELLTASGLTVGVAAGDGVRVAGELIHKAGTAPVTSYAGAKMLSLHRLVDAMVVMIEDDSPLRTGLAVDRCDAVILAGEKFNTSGNHAHDSHALWLQELLRCLLPACDGIVAHRKTGPWRDGGAPPAVVKQLSSTVWHELPEDETAAIARALQLIRTQVVDSGAPR